MRIETFGSCVFWHHWVDVTDDEFPVVGDCRRNPPVLTGSDEDRSILRVDERTSRLVNFGEWPSTCGTDWCGEFRQGGTP